MLNENSIVKLIDFGFSKKLKDYVATTKTMLGTAITMAPEIN